MHLKTKTTVQSQAFPGVSFTVRTLNSVQRARRDAAIAEHRREHTRLTTELGALVAQHVGTGTEEERTAKLAALDPGVSLQMESLYEEARLIYDQHIAPAMVRAALVSIEGVEGLTVETLFDEAPDELLEEISKACQDASGLSAEKQKN